MRRQSSFLILIILVLIGGCRREAQAPSTDAGTDGGEAIEAPPPPPEVREILDAVEPAIPLWPGARATSVSVRSEGSSTIIDLWSNDSFPMIWHYYVTYLAQYRAWEPLSPYPPREGARQLRLDLNEVMQDPFVPGTALTPDDDQIVLMLREDPTDNRVNIRYVISPAAPRDMIPSDGEGPSADSAPPEL